VIQRLLSPTLELRVMVSINKLVEISGDKYALCGEGLHLKEDVKTIGSRVEVVSNSENGHCQKWVSSEVLP